MAKIVPLLKVIAWQLCWRFFSSVFRFCKIEVIFNENLSFIDCASAIWLPHGCKMSMDCKKNNVKFCANDVIVIFWRCHVSFVKFNYWSKFHVNIIAGSGAMTIFVYKVIRNHWPEIRKSEIPLSKFCPISGEQGELGIPNLFLIKS